MDNMYDFCIIITTYNRPNMLYSLIENLFKEKGSYNINIAVFNDGSSEKYDLTNYDVKHIRMYPNMGKQKYYVTFNSTFSYVKRIDSKYFIYLPDDVILMDDFFNKVKQHFQKNLPFVIYKKPNSELIIGLFQNDGKLIFSEDYQKLVLFFLHLMTIIRF